MKNILQGQAKYLLREVSESGSQLLEIHPGDRFAAKKGSIYAVLRAEDLDPIDVLLGTKRGDTLVITLPDGTLVEIAGYFPQGSNIESGETFADFSTETLLKITEEAAGVGSAVNWYAWGLGGAAVLGGAALAASATGDDSGGSNLTVDLGERDEGPTSKTFDITGINSRSIQENKEYISEKPSVVNAEGSVTWSLEGEDAALFSVQADTGIVKMLAKNHEEPVDGGANNSYSYILVATDEAGNQTREEIVVSVSDIDEASTIVIQGLESAQIAENVTQDWTAPVITGAVGKLTWGLTGEDADLFVQDPVTGALSFRGGDYEAAADANRDNVYRVRVTARDEDNNYAFKDLSVTVNDLVEASQINLFGVNDSVVLESATYFSGTPTITGAIGKVTWRLEGDDAALFSLDTQTGALSLSAQDYENPNDIGGDNIYSTVLVAVDEDGNRFQKPLRVTVLDRDENTSSNGTSTDGQNTSAQLIEGLADTVVVEHRDALVATPYVVGLGGPFEWSLQGEDEAFFFINQATGELTFKGLDSDGHPGSDFEAPTDNDRDNVYKVSVRATHSSTGKILSRDVSVSVANDAFEVVTQNGGVNLAFPEELVLFENDTLVLPTPLVPNISGEITWVLSGADAQHFTITDDGVISLLGTLDYELPADRNADNRYDLQLVALQDSAIVARQNIGVRVKNVNEAADTGVNGDDDPVGFSVNGLVNATVTEHKNYTSLEPWVVGAGNNLQWSLYGEDAEFFTIDSQTGTVSFAAQDYENPQDTGRDNIYRYGVRAEDQISGEVLAKELVLYVADDPSEWGSSAIVVQNTGAAFNDIFDVDENRFFRLEQPEVSNAVGSVTWSLRGEDALRFSVDPNSGLVTLSGKNFELPNDANQDNIYSAELVARDEDQNIAWVPLSVQINDVVETSQLTIAGIQNTSVRENFDFESTRPTVIGAIGEVQWAVSGVDADQFSIDQNTGVLTMLSKDFESPQDSSGDNVYRVTINAIDSDGNQASKNIAVAIDNVNESGDSVNTGTTPNQPPTGVDTDPPLLVAISSSAGDAEYGFGETLYITAAFNKPVKLVSGSVPPFLELSNGEKATYYSGNGSYQVTFQYTVKPSDFIEQLNVDLLNYGSLMGSNNVSFSQSTTNTISSNLANNAQITLDATPRVVAINSTIADGTYGPGAVIPIEVSLDQVVTATQVSDVPAILALNNGRQASYVSGTGSDTLLFEYTVGLNDDVADLDVLALAENGMGFVNTGGLALSDNLASIANGGFAQNTDIDIGMPLVPSITDIQSVSPEGAYILGDTIYIDVIFDQAVFLKKGAIDFDELTTAEQDAVRPYLALNSGGTAEYFSGNGTNSLRFIYVPMEGDLASQLDVLSFAENGTSLIDGFGNIAETAITGGTFAANHALTVDAESPVIVSMVNNEPTPVLSENGKYRVTGEIAVTFSSELYVSGSDSKLIISGLDDPNNLSFPAIGVFERIESDNKTLVYSYDGYLSDELIPIEATALIENGTVILDLAGNTAKTKIVSGQNDVAGTALLAGAGEFITETLGLRILSSLGEELVNTAYDPTTGIRDIQSLVGPNVTGPVMIEIYDVNGAESDYRDEYTGDFKSLSVASGDQSLRLVVDADQLSASDVEQPLTITPLSELAVRLALRIGGHASISYPLDETFLIANQLVADLLGLESIANGPISFVDGASFDVLDGVNEAEKFGLALGMMSTLDSQTESIFETIDLLLAAWTEDARASQLGAPSSGSLEAFLHRAIDLLSNSTNTRFDAESRVALQTYVSKLTPYQNPEEVPSDEGPLQDGPASKDDELILDTISDDSASNPDDMTIAGTSSSANRITLTGSNTELLFTPGAELSRTLTNLMMSLNAETDAESEAAILRDLAVYTAASRVRSVLLAPAGTLETTVEDYEQLGINGVSDVNRGLVDAVIKSALMSGDTAVDLGAQVASKLAQFDSLRSWALQSSETQRVSVLVGNDPAAQLDRVADKLDQLFPNSDYDDVLVDFLTQELRGEGDRYVLATLDDDLTEASLLASVELPADTLSAVLAAGSLVIEGRDTQGRWQLLSEIVSADGESGVISLEPMYQGMTGYRLSVANDVASSVREALAGESIIFETRSIHSDVFAEPLEGVANLATLAPVLAAQLLQWSGAQEWADYQALDQVIPVFKALHDGYVDFYEGSPDAMALRAMLRLSLSLPEASDTAALSHLLSTAGAFSWSDVESLTGIELTSDAAVDALLQELSSAYASESGVAAVVSQLHKGAWLAESESLLAESFDELASQVFRLSNEDMSDQSLAAEIARLGSVIKFKQLLDGADVVLTADDVEHFGLSGLSAENIPMFTTYLSAQSSELNGDTLGLQGAVNSFVERQLQAQLALDALLEGPSWIERDVAVETDTSLSRLMTLLSAEYGENTAAFNGLVAAVLGAVSETEQVLATFSVSDGPVSQLEFLDASGDRMMASSGLSVRGFAGESDIEGELLTLTPVPGEVGRFALPTAVSSYTHFELVAEGYVGAVPTVSAVRVMGETYGLTPDHLASLGYEGLGASDIPILYKLAAAADAQADTVVVDDIVSAYEALRPVLGWQNGQWLGQMTDEPFDWTALNDLSFNAPYVGNSGPFGLSWPLNLERLWNELDAEERGDLTLVAKDESEVIWDNTASDNAAVVSGQMQNSDAFWLENLPTSLAARAGGIRQTFDWLEPLDGTSDFQ